MPSPNFKWNPIQGPDMKWRMVVLWRALSALARRRGFQIGEPNVDPKQWCTTTRTTKEIKSTKHHGISYISGRLWAWRPYLFCTQMPQKSLMNVEPSDGAAGRHQILKLFQKYLTPSSSTDPKLHVPCQPGTPRRGRRCLTPAFRP